MNPLIDIAPGLMIWTLLAFGVAMLVLRKKAWPEISRILDERQEKIDGAIDHAEKTRREADELLEEYRGRLREAREQAEDIVARSRKAAEKAVEQATAEGRAKREELVSAARKDIEMETKRSLDQIRREVADLTLLATEKVTRKSLDDDDHRRLVEEALSEVDFSALSADASARSN